MTIDEYFDAHMHDSNMLDVFDFDSKVGGEVMKLDGATIRFGQWLDTTERDTFPSDDDDDQPSFAKTITIDLTHNKWTVRYEYTHGRSASAPLEETTCEFVSGDMETYLDWFDNILRTIRSWKTLTRA
jgi:hypothetical protein